HTTENRSVGGSIPPPGTIYSSQDISARPKRVGESSKLNSGWPKGGQLFRAVRPTLDRLPVGAIFRADDR
ncbi:MAG TPA: hypothetical protein PKD99_09470, partial [Sphingopyxis sp.]|nr:hypothetical protein [Sphingopyxis sp.]